MSLTEMRKNSGNLVTYLLFAIIIIVFVFTFNTIGPSEACGGSQGPAGPNRQLSEVGDESIDTNRLVMAEQLIITPASPRQRSQQALTRNFYYRATRYYFSPMRRSAYADYGVEAFDFTPIKIEKAMNTLQETLLVSEEARKIGLEISNAELRERLSGTPIFLEPKSGRFSAKMWEDWVRRQRTTPTRMEEFLKQELLREKLVALVVAGVTVGDDELSFYHRATNEKVNLEYVEIDERSASPLVAVADDDVKTWLQANQDKVKKYYEDKRADYNKDERVVFRGIQFRAPNKTIIAREKDEKNRKSMQSERDAAKKKAQAALALLNSKAAAAANTGDAKKAEGSDGEDKAGDAKKAAGKDKAGDAKKAAGKDKAGDAKKAAGKDKAGDAKKAAGKDKAGDAKKAAGKDKAGDAKKVAGSDGKDKAGDDKKATGSDKKAVITAALFGEVAEDQSDHESKVKGGLFDKGYDKKQLSRYPFGAALAEAAFTMAAGGTSGVVEVNDGFWIIHKVKTLDAEKRDLGSVEMEIATKLFRQQKVGAFVEDLAKDVLAEAKKDTKKTLADVVTVINAKYKAGDEGLSSDETGLFPRLRSAFGVGGSVPGLGTNEALSAAGFAASKEAPLLSEVFTDEAKKKRYVVRLIAREEAGEMKAEDMKQTKEQLLEQRKRTLYAAWLRSLIAEARADGKITETNDWAKLVTDQRRQYVEDGGQLGGVGGAKAAGLQAMPLAGQ